MSSGIENKVLFDNPFNIEDIQIFDDVALSEILAHQSFGVCYKDLAHSLHGASDQLLQRVIACLPDEAGNIFTHELRQILSHEEVIEAQQKILNDLFWELTYWKTPDFYEELTEGELLHPDIFRSLAPYLRDRKIVDVGAGSGRATFECMDCGASYVYAIEPSPGLLRLLHRKIVARGLQERASLGRGRFADLSLPDRAVDVALTCSAFTTQYEQGGEEGLQEMQRVVRPGGKIVIIWPRPEDHKWLYEHGFRYQTFPGGEEMKVQFRSLQSALHCAHLFYGGKPEVLEYVQKTQRSSIPFAVIGMNPPCDYFWLDV